MTKMERVATRDILMSHFRAIESYCKEHPACDEDECPAFYIDDEGFDACRIAGCCDLPPSEWETEKWDGEE